MKTQVELSKQAGKTIEAVTYDYGSSRLVITFTEGTFSILEIQEDYDGYTLASPQVELAASGFSDLLVRAGVAEQAELDTARAERRAQADLAREQAEREQLARLKAKFGE